MAENTKSRLKNFLTNKALQTFFFTFELISVSSLSFSLLCHSRQLFFAVNLMTSFSRQKPLKSYNCWERHSSVIVQSLSSSGYKLENVVEIKEVTF